MNIEALIPKLGVVTDIRTDTPDVKTFRVLGLDGKKVLNGRFPTNEEIAEWLEVPNLPKLLEKK